MELLSSLEQVLEHHIMDTLGLALVDLTPECFINEDIGVDILFFLIMVHMNEIRHHKVLQSCAHCDIQQALNRVRF